MTTKISFVWVKRSLVFTDMSMYRPFRVTCCLAQRTGPDRALPTPFCPVSNNSIFPRAVSSSVLLIEKQVCLQRQNIPTIQQEVTSQACYSTYATRFGRAVSDILRFEVFTQRRSCSYEHLKVTIPHTYSDNSKTAGECGIF